MKKNTYIILIAITVFLILFFMMQFMFSDKESTVPSEKVIQKRKFPLLTLEECAAQGGDVINTLNEKSIYAPSDILGEVEGVGCPCLCVRQRGNSGMFLSE